MDWFYYMAQSVLVLDFLVADSSFVEDEGENHEGLHEESPADAEEFGGFDVHDPGGDHGRV